MKDQDLLERITVSPKVMAGKPIITGTRLTVEYILNLLAHGATTEDSKGISRTKTRRYSSLFSVFCLPQDRSVIPSSCR